MLRPSILRLGAAILLAGVATNVVAAEFDWRAHEGESVTFLASGNPLATLLIQNEAEFEALTGIDLIVDSYSEQQMRQRLMTVMNARSDEIDVFMSMTSREGMLFAQAGWYQDLTGYAVNNVASDYNFDGFGKALIDAATFDGKVIGVPLNIEGPLMYVRKDIFAECGIDLPETLADLADAAAQIKECSDVTPFATRGLSGALPYTFSGFLRNMGGSYMEDGASALCSDESKAAIALYADLLGNYGPPGAVNYSFPQLTSLYREGQSAMSFASSNEFSSVMEGGARVDDTTIMPLPGGPGGVNPTVIGWSLAISGNSANSEAAWYFLQWATSPEMQARFALEGIAPPREAVAQSAEFKAWLDESGVRQEWMATLATLAATGSGEIGYPIVGNPESRQYIGKAVGDVLLGSATVEDACAAADRELNALILRD